MLLALGLVACGSSTGSSASTTTGSSSTSSSTSGTSGIAPCTHFASFDEVCNAQCGGCGCIDEGPLDCAELVSCMPPASCPTMLKGDRCAPYCGGPCATQKVQTACGSEEATPTCTIFGWVRGVQCKTADCGAITDPDACDADPSCVWIVPCHGEPEPKVHCLSATDTSTSCLPLACRADQHCSMVKIDYLHPRSTQCAGEGVGDVAVCAP